MTRYSMIIKCISININLFSLNLKGNVLKENKKENVTRKQIK